MDPTALKHFVVGGLGCLCLEFVKMYELRGKLHTREYRALRRSPWFYIATAGMTAVSGIVAWAVNEGREASVWQVLVAGVAARSLIRNLAEARVSNTPISMGDEKFEIKDMFR